MMQNAWTFEVELYDIDTAESSWYTVPTYGTLTPQSFPTQVLALSAAQEQFPGFIVRLRELT